jgi:hypothetical protein
MGRIAEALIKSGVKIGVSSRGAGTVTESGDVSSFSFCTIDLVAKPSAPNALPNSVYESLEMDKDGRKVLTLAEQLRDDPKVQKYFKDMFMKVLSNGLFTKK